MEQGSRKAVRCVEEALCDELQSMFPGVPRQQLLRRLRESELQVEAAAEALLGDVQRWEQKHKHKHKQQAKKEQEEKKEEDKTTTKQQEQEQAVPALQDEEAAILLLFPNVSAREVQQALQTSCGEAELAADLLQLSADYDTQQHQQQQQHDKHDKDDRRARSLLALSVSDLQAAFPDQPPEALESELRANDGDLQTAALAILRRSTSGLSPRCDTDSNVAFLQSMFPTHAQDVLRALLEEMEGHVEEVVDFLMSVEFIEGQCAAEAVSGGDEGMLVEVQMLRQMFPDHDPQSIVDALDSCGWDAGQAASLLLPLAGEPGKPKKGPTKWKKLDTSLATRMYSPMRWNGINSSVMTARPVQDVALPVSARQAATGDRKPVAAKEPTTRQPSKPSVTVASKEKPSLLEPQLDAKAMAEVHAQRRQQFAGLAARAHVLGDGNCAARFRRLAEREDRLRQMWADRQRVTVVDLHGLLVAEALEVVRGALSKPNCTFHLITGRGAHSHDGGKMKSV